MSQYTTNEVLAMMEQWHEEHRDDADFDEWRPFKGFDWLAGKDLSGIDLSRDTVKEKAEEYIDKSPSRRPPPWVSPSNGGIYLASAILSGEAEENRTSLGGARLQGADLNGVHLEGAGLDGAHLEEALLWEASLRGASVRNAYLEKAELLGALLEDADLTGAKLEGTKFGGAKLRGAYLDIARFEDARLEDVDWVHGHRRYWIGEEIDAESGDPFARWIKYDTAETPYRRLKLYYSRTGQHEHAGEFHIREMMMRRKKLWRQPEDDRWQRIQHKLESLTLFVFQLSCGFGERPSWVLGWGFLAWLGFVMAYYLAQGTADGAGYGLGHFREAVYYSSLAFVSFRPPGGEFRVPNWAGGVGLIEALLAYFLLALFLVTFVRKMART